MASERILVVDDEIDLAVSCQRLLDSKGYETSVAANGEEALQFIQNEEPHLVITDLKMPGMNGMELLKQIKELYPEIQVLMMTAYSTIEDAVDAMRLGAHDFVPKPFTPEHLGIVVEKALADRVLREENRHLREQLGQHFSFDNIIGKSPAMTQIFDSIRKIADSNINVLISGASGTGKELIARSIHVNSRRGGRPFVALNCGALPEHLVESEIFGYERGAFTGAARPKPGLLETAHGGTFFMDEIGELPASLQVKFLRVLQDGKFRRLGSTQEREVDVRLICATNQELEKRLEEGDFREDLYYRINTFTIAIPPLKERRDDIPLLAGHFLQKYGEQNQKFIEVISMEAMELLRNHEWKGNVRELEHVIERALVLASDDNIQVEDLPQNIQAVAAEENVPPRAYMDLPFKDAKAQLIEDFERRYIVEVLGKYQGNISRAAVHSGIDRRSLHRLLAKYEIDAAEVARES
ncbi:MAG: sigma-54-dependent Fis family transcriptional regulator [Gemmatimonadetes bacterium]|jgi:DNA-binding NtrC family response regulator|nr:sigma-54-dependent Fis family transcriptional regulator [Gemmatimonadota bacterium]